MTNDGTQGRVARMAEDAEAYLRELYERLEGAEDGPTADEIQEEIDSFDHGVEIQRHVLITLAGGGPSHWLDATIGYDGTISDLVSIARWGSSETRTEIRPGSALWRYAENAAEYARDAE